MKTHNIMAGASTADIQSIIANASSGDTILFEPGTYFEDNGVDALSLWNLNFDKNNPLTITSKDGGKVVFDGKTTIRNSAGIVFDEIIFQDKINPNIETENANEAAILIRSSENIEIQDSVIKGTLLQATDEVKEGDDYLQKFDGYYVGNGVYISHGNKGVSRNITIKNSQITELGHGIVLNGTEGVSIQGNAINKIRVDGIRGGNHHGTQVTDNYFAEFRSWQADPNNPNGWTGEHGDMIQYWTYPTGTGISDFTIKRNIFFDASNTFSDNDGNLEHVQIIQGRETRGAKEPNDGNDFNNFIIEDNLIYGGQANALRIEDVNGGSIKNNTLIPNAESPDKKPFIPLIQVRGHSTDLDISGNVAPISPNVRVDSEITIAQWTQDYNATQSDPIRLGDNYGYYVQDFTNLFAGLREAYDMDRDITLDDLFLTDAEGLVNDSFGSSLSNIDNLDRYVREQYFEDNEVTKPKPPQPQDSILISFDNANNNGNVLGTAQADVMQAEADNSSGNRLRALGRDGNDTLTGASNVDMSGENGDDLLILNGGDSFIWGGSGSDTFVITSETKSGSTILDFQKGVDTIVFEEIEGVSSMSDLNITPQNPNFTANSFINFGDEQIKIKGMMVEDFSAENFQFS